MGARGEGPPPVAGVPDRLYGRRRGHPLRPRQRRLLGLALPRLAFPAAAAGDPLSAFPALPPDAPLWLEVGAGSGEHARALAAEDPGRALIAAEVFENGLSALLAPLLPEGEEETAPPPPNLRPWPGDARRLLAALPDGALSGLVLMFPDPWPKARHAKRRFLHPAALPLLAAKLRPGAAWRLASDDPTHQAWVEEVLGGQDAFAPEARWSERPPGWPATRYEAKARRAGRAPLWWLLRRR